MIVKNISAIQYFIERFDILDAPYQYTVDYHIDAPRKTFITNPTFMAEFHDCTTHSLPLLITNENHLITSHIWPLLHNTKYKPKKTHGLWSAWGENIDISLSAPAKKFEEEYKYVWLPIDELSANNAWHIWIDVISKFRLMEKKFSHKYTDFIYVLSNSSEYFDRVAGELFPELRYYVMPKNTTWKFAHLLVPSMSNHEDGVTVPEMPKWLRHKFGQKIEPTRKIFISREDAPARKLINAEEVFMALQGWETVTLSGMITQKQIELFSGASHVISTHGAGLANLLWCQAGTKIIEISQKELLDKKVYPVLSHHLGLSHHVLLGKKVPIAGDKTKGVKRKKDFNDITVNKSALFELINQVQK